MTIHRNRIIDPEHADRRGPRRIRLRLDDVPGEPVVVKATLVPTFGDVIALYPVMGCRYRQDALARLAVGRPRDGFPCLLVHEPFNPHDHRAIAVWTRGGRCGYLERAINPQVLPRLDALEAEHGTPIAVRGSLACADHGLDLLVELPEALQPDRWRGR
jgi:hypothetical protein